MLSLLPALTGVCAPAGTISSKVRYRPFTTVRIVLIFPVVEISKSPVSKVSPELAKHEAAQHKVSREMKRKRDAEDQG